jgi:hypothetical protein
MRIPAATARKVADRDPSLIRRPGFNPRHGFDMAFGELCHELVGPLYGLVYPNLVQHRGDLSAVEPGRPWRMRAGWLAQEPKGPSS